MIQREHNPSWPAWVFTSGSTCQQRTHFSPSAPDTATRKPSISVASPFDSSNVCTATCEVMSFGQLSKWYQSLAPKQTRAAISSHFDCDEKQFEGLLQHLVYLRNTCAHHSRLWNRKFTKTIAKPRNKPLGLAQQCNFDQTTSADRKLYNSLVFLLYFMDKITLQHTWRQRLIDLLLSHTNISKTYMGFPEDWQTYPIWQIKK